jgi:aryl-alcohol dehydrogenase (NADP+)
MGVVTWTPLCGGWLTGRYRTGSPVASSPRTDHYPERFDPAFPQNQRKYQLVEELIGIAADAGLPLTHLALGFVTSNPAVSAAIIGPRTMEQLVDQLPALELELDESVLRRLDELIPPGTTIDPADAGYAAPSPAPHWSQRVVTRA